MNDVERLRVLVIGAGGREHALAWKLSQSPSVDSVHVAPGNGGTQSDKISNVDIQVTDFDGLVTHARNNLINLVVVGPEQPLVDGITDIFESGGIPCFGPSRAAARMEASKAFSKDFMERHGIPTAAYRRFDQYDEARRYVDAVQYDMVIKADGLAAGKGVIIPTSKDEAHTALKDMMLDRQFGDAGAQVVIEEFLEGEELSVLTFSDGYTIRSLPPAQDHKRAFDGDRGPNTGGMGCYAPTRVASKELIAEIDRTIIQPTVDAMRKEWMPFVGMLFTGLMITKDGPKVLEYNVRGGDPETETLLPLLSPDTDLAQVMLACTKGCLDAVDLEIEPKFSATVVACSGGYPGSYFTGAEITFKPPPQDTLIFHAGTSRRNGKLLTSGGRVIATTSIAPTIEAAVEAAYQAMANITFPSMHFRKDIAHRALQPSPTTNTSNTTHSSTSPLTYASAGVSIDAGNTLVDRIKPFIKSTARPGADAEIGGFGGSISLLSAGYTHPPTITIATDGVGTKLKLAWTMNTHSSVGIDLVAMNVNDLIVQGAEPLAFVDCYSCSTLDVNIAVDVVKGIAEGCRIAGCALVGGETAEMPGLGFVGSEYDITGTAVGAFDTQEGTRTMLPDKSAMTSGDILLGLASSGVHSNGFSLVRRILDRQGLDYHATAPWDESTSVGLSLLTPTRIYVRPLLRLLKDKENGRDLVKGMSHITGGGLTENVPRMLPAHLSAEIDVRTWQRPGVFSWLQQAGNVSAAEMARTFNNGIGMVLVVSRDVAGKVEAVLRAEAETVFRVGRLVERMKGMDGCLLKGTEAWESR